MADLIPVMRTKILVPRRRAELLTRRRLLDLFEELLDNRLIILAAPAGYGKTSLLVDFAHSSEWPVCWYALDTLDQDPQRFITHLIAAINLRFPQFGKSCLAALRSMTQDSLDLDSLVSLMVNDIYEKITEHFLVILDDFHLVESNKAIVTFVNQFLQALDENCHVVLASRTLLTLPDLPLMVARSLVGGLSYEELSFRPEEIQGLLETNYQLTLSEAEAAELAKETEGWVTGLLLSTQVMGKTIAQRLRVTRVSGVGLYEYLAQQVFERQPPDVRSFLMWTALLEEFDASWCDDVIGPALGIQADWRALMDAVMHHNLFILPVGDDGMTLRYHHLFQDFLRTRIDQDDPATAQAIRMRLAEVLTNRGDWERAFAIYQRAGATDHMVNLVKQAGSDMITHGRLVTLTGWLDSLPPDLLKAHPSLVSLQGTAALERGNPALGAELHSQAITVLRRQGDWLQLAHGLVRRTVAYRLLGQYREALSDVEEALALFAENGKDNILYADALYNRAFAYYYLGRIGDAMTEFKQTSDAYLSFGDHNSVARVWMWIGLVSKALGQFKEAERAYQQSYEYYQTTGNLVLLANLSNNIGVLQHVRGDFHAATSSLERAIHYARMSGAIRLEAYALASIGDLYLELDAFQEAQEAYRQAREIATRTQEAYLLLYLNLAESRLAQALNEPARARELLRAARAMVADHGSRYEENACRLEEARLALAERRYLEARECAISALEYFVQEGYRVETPRARVFVMAACHFSNQAAACNQLPEMETLLGNADVQKILATAARELKTYLPELKKDEQIAAISGGLTGLVSQFEASIPALRRLVRRQAVVVPFAPPRVIIRALGRIQVRVSDRQITSADWQTQTARDLFFVLAAHPEGLTKEEIGMMFWPDSSTSELKLRFKNTIYRLRHAAGKDVILFQGDDLYLFNRGLDYEYDVETFTKELSQADRQTDRKLAATHYQNALKAYRGPYLPEVDLEWAAVERERLRQRMMEAVLRLATHCFDHRDYDAAQQYCQQALNDDPCMEEAHRLVMRIYAAQGNRALVIRQYEQCCQALLEDVGADPSSQTIELYNQLTR